MSATVVSTPEMLKDMLAKVKMNLYNIRCLTLDEAARLVYLGFEDKCLITLKHRGKFFFFSATMHTKIQNFPKSVLAKSVNVSLDAIQEEEYVKLESKNVHLLECLQKKAFRRTFIRA